MVSLSRNLGGSIHEDTSAKMMDNNTIEERINNCFNEASDICISRSDETSGCSLVEKLEENIAVLRVEALQIAKIDNELETKLHNFNEASNSITSKLHSLIKLSDLRFGDRDEIKQFVEQITLSWLNTNKQVMKEYAGIHVASRTVAGTPLSTLLEKKKKEAAAIKVSLQIGSVIYDQDYVFRGYKLYDEICRVLESMNRCDDKIQQCMVICKTTPYLFDLSASIDNFVANTNLLPTAEGSSISSEDLRAFSFVSRLLTGELLGYEPINPRRVLAASAPRKPVFITFNRASNNTKRKTDIPKTRNGSKILRRSSFPSVTTSK